MNGIGNNFYIMERFMNFVDKKGEDECWEWTGCLWWNGYGRFSVQDKSLRAHRVSYELFNGKRKNGLIIMHTCDNKKCVNPKHLEAGTRRRNLKDAHKRGLHKRKNEER